MLVARLSKMTVRGGHLIQTGYVPRSGYSADEYKLGPGAEAVVGSALRPAKWIAFNESFSRRLPGWEERRTMKAFGVCGRLEGGHSEAGQGWDAGCGYLPQGRNQPGDLFQLEKKYDGLLPTKMRRLKQLEDENAKLRKVVADLSLDEEMLQDAIAPKALKPARKRKLVDEVRGDWGYRSGGAAGCSRSLNPPVTTSPNRHYSTVSGSGRNPPGRRIRLCWLWQSATPSPKAYSEANIDQA